MRRPLLVVRLLDATKAHQGSVFGLAEVIAALRDDQPAVVVQRDDEVVGAVVATGSGDRAWVTRLPPRCALRDPR